jgi:hypothetical protein
MGIVYKILVVKAEGKIPLRRPRRRWEVNIRIDVMEMRWVSNGCILLRIGTSGGLL